VCWRLDRLGRKLKHLIMLLGIAFVTLAKALTP